jgi:RNA polymerase sigma factor (sigma-70 family)
MEAHPVHAALTSDYVSKLLKTKARQLRRRPEFWRADLQDIQQELVLHVVQRAHLFDPARGGVNTFIATVVESAAAMLCRDRKRLKRAAGLNLQSLEGSTLQDEGEEKTLLDVLVDDDLRRRQASYGASDEERCDASADTAEVLSRLSSPLRKVARLQMAGENEVSIARTLGISRRQARKAIEKICEHFRQADLE